MRSSIDGNSRTNLFLSLKLNLLPPICFFYYKLNPYRRRQNEEIEKKMKKNIFPEKYLSERKKKRSKYRGDLCSKGRWGGKGAIF